MGGRVLLKANGPEPSEETGGARSACAEGSGRRLQSSPEPQLDSDSPREFGQGPLSFSETHFLSLSLKGGFHCFHRL